MRIMTLTFALVVALAGVSDAAIVSMDVTPNGGGAGIDQYDFWLDLVPADGDFLNARLTVAMQSACIQDPDQDNTTGGTGGVPVDTWVSTVFDYAGGSGASIIFNAYDPVFPPPVDPTPVALLDWSFYDTYAGDDHNYTPALISRVLIDAGCVGVGDMLVFTEATAGVGENFRFDIPEPATLALLGVGLVGMVLRRRRA